MAMCIDDADTRRARALRVKLEAYLRDRHSYTASSELDEEIVSLIRDVRAAERERACKAICPDCALGFPVVVPENIPGNGLAHINQYDGGYDYCRAAAIREPQPPPKGTT